MFIKVSEYDEKKNVNTIHIVFGIGVRHKEKVAIQEQLKTIGYKSSGSSHDPNSNCSVYAFELDQG